MGKLRLAGADQSAEEVSESFGTFRFGLKLNVECSATLWSAAAERCARDFAIAADELIDLLGPEEDPSIEDCLMLLTLPVEIPGCTLLDASLDKVLSGPALGPSLNANQCANKHAVTAAGHEMTAPFGTPLARSNLPDAKFM